MSFARWAKKAQSLAVQHSDKVISGVDQVSAKAKQTAPGKASYIDKAAQVAKKAVEPK